MNGLKRIVFLDYLRVVAILMVMFVHACEQFYFGQDGGFLINTWRDAVWVTAIDSACRAAVPLFVMASAYLLFPVTKPTGAFLRHRLLRVGVPFVLWACVYTWRFDGAFCSMLFNFPMATGGHLWFVPMLIGLYLVMPLLSPWAERASEREVRGWLVLWLFTTTFPFLRHVQAWWLGAPSFGAVPYLYGECPWNGFGAFQHVSGFFGYLLLGFWFRKFAPALSWRRTLAWALPTGLVGWAIVAGGFFFRIPSEQGYPVTGPYALAVDLEMSWEFCSTGVALTVIAYFLILRKLNVAGWFYERIIRPLSAASYGVYLMHILVLVVLAERLKPAVSTSAAIFLMAVGTFAASSLVALLLRQVPFVGRRLVGCAP